jgi:hypothetical protein
MVCDLVVGADATAIKAFIKVLIEITCESGLEKFLSTL